MKKESVTLYNGHVHNNDSIRPAIHSTCYKCNKDYNYNPKHVYELIDIKVNNGKYDTYVLKNIKTGKTCFSLKIAVIITVSITDWSAKIAASITAGNGQIDFQELKKQLETCGIKTIEKALQLFESAKAGNDQAAYDLFNYMFNADMTGKMQDVLALGTSCKLNPHCKMNQKIKGSICEWCYAENMRRTTAYKQAFNTYVLCTYLFPENQIPYINRTMFRFESFADLLNDIQLRNYINIAAKNNHVECGIFTKRPAFLYNTLFKYYAGLKPENLNVIVSSLYLNVIADYKGRFMLADGRDMINHIFTVFTADYALKHNIVIHCGTSICINCRRCYSSDTEFYVNEIVKQQAAIYYAAIGKEYHGRK